MASIETFRIQTEQLHKDKFVAIADHLGMRAEVKATPAALFMQDKERSLAYALPGARLGGLLFFIDQSQGLGTLVERAPGHEEVERWTREFLERFQLGPRDSSSDRIRTTMGTRVLRTEAMQEGQDRSDVRRVPVKTDVVSDLRLNDHHVTGPRAKIRLIFKHARQPACIHRSLWEKLEVFDERPMLSEDEAYHRVSNRIARRGQASKNWRMLNMRLAYYADELSGAPDLLLPYYFIEVEYRDPKSVEPRRQGARQLIKVPASR